jgi:hypothetical protein
VVNRRFSRRTYLPRNNPIHHSPLASVVLLGLFAGEPREPSFRAFLMKFTFAASNPLACR